MAAVKSLCTRAMVLDDGKLAFSGGTEESIQFYLQNNNEKGSDNLRYYDEKLFLNKPFKLIKSSLYAKGKKVGEPIDRGDAIIFSTVLINTVVSDIYLVYRFKDDRGEYLFICSSAFSEFKLNFEGEKEVLMTIPPYFFNEGFIYVDVMISDNRNKQFLETDALCLLIVQDERPIGSWMGKTPGALKPNFEWEFV
jgi:lipopolysaccharide transport system ATP-binding protein